MLKLLGQQTTLLSKIPQSRRKISERQAKGAAVLADPHLPIQPTLPPEIVEKIIVEALDTLVGRNQMMRQLCLFACSSRVLQAQAERFIYRQLVFHVGQPESETIATMLRTRAARYVRQLNIMNYAHGPTSPSRIRTLPETGVSAIPFALMTNLEILEVNAEDDGHDHTCHNVDPELFVLLQKHLTHECLLGFVCQLPLRPTDLRFLDKQTRIVTLSINPREVNGYYEPADLLTPSHGFPNLTILQIRQMDSAAAAYVGKAKLENLNVFDQIYISGMWASIGSNLTKLNATFCEIDPWMLSTLARESPRLRLLTFFVADMWLLRPDDHLFEIIEEFKNLLALCVIMDVSHHDLRRIMAKYPKRTPMQSLLIWRSDEGLRVMDQLEGGRWTSHAEVPDLDRWKKDQEFYISLVDDGLIPISNADDAENS
ncbi:hypothetical protein SISNIDRAFT_482583 [Sistotremastrum niveocremeum HHB9708]|uniref:F-box domain-containing protein n=1 Tax=Sistotremastrum niveocremeum HHB9708 TaxID=1314777 RepID=A0A164YCI2_9AGAM|nr:hypothetical protein SISNIDRAFT_482583 [Sistotremastrum niveocremeum HHB9708]